MGAAVTTDREASADDLHDGPSTEPESCGVMRTTRSYLIALCRAHNKFTVTLFQEHAKDGKRPGSFAFSPVCTSLGLGIVYLGARGGTQTELYKMWHLNEVTDSELLPGYAALHWDLVRSRMPKGCELEVAVKVFAHNEYNPSPHFEEICNNYELLPIRLLDFQGRPDLARNDVNKWVEDRTRGKVKDIISMGIIDRDTKILVVSAIYIRVQWHHPFATKATEKMPFYLSMKETPMIDTMHQTKTIRYGSVQKLDADVVEIPMANAYMKFFVILPWKKDGLSKVEGKLSRTLLETITDGMSEEIVEVYLPKFTYELGYSELEYLQKIGTKEIFSSSKANLSGIEGSKGLAVTKVFHHTLVEVDEAGPDHLSPDSHLEAGASSSTSSKLFKVDHPFIFFIRDDRSGLIIVIGRIVRPTK